MYVCMLRLLLLLPLVTGAFGCDSREASCCEVRDCPGVSGSVCALNCFCDSCFTECRASASGQCQCRIPWCGFSVIVVSACTLWICVSVLCAVCFLALAGGCMALFFVLQLASTGIDYLIDRKRLQWRREALSNNEVPPPWASKALAAAASLRARLRRRPPNERDQSLETAVRFQLDELRRGLDLGHDSAPGDPGPPSSSNK